MITRDQLRSWRESDPVSKAFFNRLQEELELNKDFLVYGSDDTDHRQEDITRGMAQILATLLADTESNPLYDFVIDEEESEDA